MLEREGFSREGRGGRERESELMDTVKSVVIVGWREWVKVEEGMGG